MLLDSHQQLVCMLMWIYHAFCTTHALTRRNEGVLDCIALDEGAQVIIRTLDDMSIQSSYIINSSNGCCVFCSS